MTSLPTARGESPRLYELDPLRFQELCRDLYQTEPESITADVFGTPGQLQRGVDLRVQRRGGDGITVGQCKAVKPASLQPRILEQASTDFLGHLTYWQNQGVKKFILFVASDTSPTQIQEESHRQHTVLQELGIGYELWGQAKIVSKLRSQPGITETYLGYVWKDILCGTAISGFPRNPEILDRVLRTQVEVLAGHVSGAAANEIEALREAWRCGRRAEVISGVRRLKEPSRWQAFPPSLRSTILRFDAQLELDADNLPVAKQLASEATALDPDACARLHSLIARADDNHERALELLADATDTESIVLRAALLMESGHVPSAVGLLEGVAGHAEAHRLRALGFVVLGDLSRARLEIEKAIDLAPDRHATLLTKVITHYLSGLSPAILPRHVPPWPEPEAWHFIKTDDESRRFFSSVVETATRLEQNAELETEERRVCEAWHVAGLANDPERRDAANSYCRECLKRDPGNYRMAVWALARRLEVDLAHAVATLREKHERSHAAIPEIITLAALYAHSGQFEPALELLRTSVPLFAAAGAEELRRFWTIQFAAMAGEVPEQPVSTTASGSAAAAALVALQARAQTNGDYDPLVNELRLRADDGDHSASFELCQLLVSLERWAEALPIARDLPERVRTADSIALSCITLYNSKQHDECLRTLDLYRTVFPRAELPNDMQRLRLAAQRQLGLLPVAASTAEELFRREPSIAHFRLLSDLYFEKGDFASLVVLARRHERLPDLTTGDLLRLSLRVCSEDTIIATTLWRRALNSDLDDSEVTVALELGYKLRLDREVRPLVVRLSALATTPGGHVRHMNFDDMRDMLMARRDNIERAYQMYRAGDIPVHMFSQHVGRPLVVWCRQLRPTGQHPHPGVSTPLYLRHGWRVGMSLAFDSATDLRFHADLTALLIAYRLNILRKIEAAFSPIVLPHSTAVALAEMRDAIRPIQPARSDALRHVRDLVASHRLELVDTTVPSSPTATIPQLDAQRSQLLAYAIDSGNLLVDFLPITDESSEPAPLTSTHEAILRSPHSVVESLYTHAEISKAQKATALEALGPEHRVTGARSISKSATLLCTVGVLELLAAGRALEPATRVFNVQLARDDFKRLVLQRLAEQEADAADATWLTNVISHISQGIDDGTYRVLPDLREEATPKSDVNEDSATLTCLMELLKFQPSDGDVIWADDRWLTGFAHRDGVPVVDTIDILHMVRDRGDFSAAEFSSIMSRLREADLRFLSLSKEEIKDHVRSATAIDGALVETRELRTLRRHYAAALVDADALRLNPADEGVALEWPFVLASGSAVANSVVEIWMDDAPPDIVRPRSEWIVSNLYVPDRGRSLTQAERSPETDLRMESIALAGLLCHAISIPIDPKARAVRRIYMDWIFRRLILRRFEADPMLRTSTVDAFKELVIGTLDTSESAKNDYRLAVALIRELLVDLPEELRETLAEDGDFLGRLGISLSPVVHIGPHEINAGELWTTVTRVLATGEPAQLEANGRELRVLLHEVQGERQVILEDAAARMRYVVRGHTAGILSDSASAREATLRQMSTLFDLPASVVDDEVARVAALEDPASRVAELAQLQNRSAQNLYVELTSKLRQHQQIAASDLFPASVGAILRHLRLDDDESSVLETRLERAATMLIDEVGLEATVVRLAGLPTPLPSTVITAVGKLSLIDRRSLLKRLTREISRSPLGSVHVARLFVCYARDNSSYLRYAHMSMRSQILRSESIRSAAWLEVLRVCANEFSYAEAFRRLPVDIRLCITWAHADRVYRILTNTGVDAGWTEKHFDTWSSRLPSELAFADDGYATDLASPRRVVPLHITLAGCGYVFGDGELLNESFRAIVSQFVQNDPTRCLTVMRDLTLSPNVLNCILCRDGRSEWLSVLTDELRQQVHPEVLRAQVAAAANAIRSQTAGRTEWGLMHAVVADDPVPSDLLECLQEGLLMLDLSALHEKDRTAALLAATWSAKHASVFGSDAVSHVRSQLISLATVRNQECLKLGPANVDREAQTTLLSAAFYLYGRLEPREGSGRFKEIAELLDSLVDCWPLLVDECHQLIERLVDGLPNRESRWLWRLQIKLRAAR